MNNETNKSDSQRHENLRLIGRVVERPKDATAEQVSRWVHLAGGQSQPGSIRGVNTFRRTLHIRRWLVSTAAAAAVVLVVWAGFYMPVSTVSADEIFDSIGKTFASHRGISLKIKNLTISGHLLNMEAYAGNGGGTLYAEMSTRPISESSFPAVTSGMAFARHGEDGWILLRELRCNGRAPLAGFLPKNGAILIDWPTPTAAGLGNKRKFPLRIHLRNIQALLESLRKASSDVTVTRLDDGTVCLTGTITRPELLDASALGEAVDMSEITDVFLPNALPFLRGGNMPGQVNLAAKMTKSALAVKLSDKDLQTARRQLEVLAKLAMRTLRTQSRESLRKQKKSIRRKLRARLAGANFTILYDPARKLLLGVALRKSDAVDSIVSVDFTGKTFNRAKLRNERFGQDPLVQRVSRRQFAQLILFPMQLRAALPNGWDRK